MCICLDIQYLCVENTNDTDVLVAFLYRGGGWWRWSCWCVASWCSLRWTCCSCGTNTCGTKCIKVESQDRKLGLQVMGRWIWGWRKKSQGGWFCVSNVDFKCPLWKWGIDRILYNNTVSYKYNLNDLASSKVWFLIGGCQHQPPMEHPLDSNCFL